MLQTIGEKAQLKTGPRSVQPKGGPSGVVQSLGEKANLKPTPVRLGLNSRNTGRGTFQETGERAALKTKPIKGFTGANRTPMSDRSIEQSR